MQIVHKINDFLYTIFPELENANEKEITTAIQKYYTYGPFVPKITVNNDIVIIDVDTETIQTQDADYNKTVALCEKGKFDEAKIILEKLIHKNPSNSEFHRILGQILSEQGDQDEAINALIDALRWNSSNGWGLLMMGNIFAKHKKDLKTALIYYDQAIRANKADHITLANIAYLLFQENNLEEATKYAWETIKLNEKYPNAHFILSLIAQSENDLHSAFYSTIQAIKFSTQKDALYQNAHLVMHELVHLDLVNQARKENLNQVFISTQQNKNNFIETILSAINNLKSKIQDPSTIDFFIESIFSGLNLQTYNTPIDVFIEDFLYKEYAELRPFQFLSLFGMLQDAIKAVTDERILDIAPLSVISKTRTFSLVNAMQFKELFGIDTIQEFKPTPAELKLAESFYTEFIEYRDDRKPGEEYELVKHWAQDLGLDTFFELESETKFETKNNIDDFVNKLQQDPFGLEEPEDPFQKREMEKFQKHQEEIGTNMAIVMFMVEALNHFKEKEAADIKQSAFEIAMLGTQGIDPNKKDYIISSINNKRFSGNQVLAFYYVSWALAMPEQVQHLGLDFGKEFEMAKNIK